MLQPCSIKEPRYFVRDPFNPSSPTQILQYMKWKGYEGGKNHKSKTGLPSTDEQTMERLAKKDELFRLILEWRSLGKLDSTYATGLLAHADKDSRIHSQFTHTPSTWRLASTNPNLYNIPSLDEQALDQAVSASEIRRAIVAGPGCVLVEADFAAIEAVVTGWYAGDTDYMRLARLGIHSYLVAKKLGINCDLSWGIEELASTLSYVKKQHHDKPIYRALKKTVHLSNYGGSVYQMVKAAPSMFPTVALATELQDFYFSLCPKLKAWQTSVRARADKEGFLGGTDHPYFFKHWFWDVTNWDPVHKQVVPGSDWNRSVAFYPQSTTAGVINEAALALSDPASPCYVGDYYHGETPLRLLPYDAILAEVPEEKLDSYLERLSMAMRLPLPLLKLDHDIKVGPDWANMEPL